MAASGADNGGAAAMSVWLAGDGIRWAPAAAIGRAAMCVLTLACAGQVYGADDAPPSGHAAQTGDYASEVAKEAASLRPAQRVEPDSPAAAPTAESERIDRIKSLVDEALAEPGAAREWESSTGAAEQPPDTETGDARRRELRELVTEPPARVRSEESGYLGALRDEVSKTVVFGEAKPAEGGVPARAAEGEGRASAAGKGGGHGSGRYSVRPGDSLWKIAQEQYGDGYAWTRIYEANRERLRSGDVLRIGQVLILPGR